MKKYKKVRQCAADKYLTVKRRPKICLILMSQHQHSDAGLAAQQLVPVSWKSHTNAFIIRALQERVFAHLETWKVATKRGF